MTNKTKAEEILIAVREQQKQAMEDVANGGNALMGIDHYLIPAMEKAIQQARDGGLEDAAIMVDTHYKKAYEDVQEAIQQARDKERERCAVFVETHHTANTCDGDVIRKMDKFSKHSTINDAMAEAIRNMKGNDDE